MTMKFLLSFLVFFSLISDILAQEPTYFVEIGAYAEPVKMDYFQKMSNVYETVDANWIYRYRIDVADKNEGEQTLKAAKSAGFAYARLVDVDFSRACCSNQCGYVPPVRTNAKHMPINNPTAKNDFRITDGGRIIMDGKKKTKKSDVYTAENTNKTNTEVVVDNSKPSKTKKNADKSTKNNEPAPNNTQAADANNPQNGDKSAKTADQNNSGAKPQTEPKTTEEPKPKKKRRQIYNKETGRMEDI